MDRREQPDPDVCIVNRRQSRRSTAADDRARQGDWHNAADAGWGDPRARIEDAGGPHAQAEKIEPNWLALACALVLAFGTSAPAFAQQLPTGGSVTAGSAAIVQPNAGTLNINQSTSQAIINWNSFSVGRGGTVNFNQPGATSSTLNRVGGNTPSWIAGTINAPGTVLLVNPNGIAISKSGTINTGSFLASTLGISDQDYLNGNYRFNGNGSSARVVNNGHINVSDGGFAALLGGQVANNGVIAARLGKVGLGAGEQATIDLAGDGFLSVAVPSNQLGNLRDSQGRPLVSNKGTILANGGTVYLSAATAANVLRDAVYVPGTIRANSVGGQNGHIVIGGGAGGKVNISGHVTANGGRKGSGGTIAVTGASVSTTGRITANGLSGGSISVAADNDLSLSGTLAAKGRTGAGGEIDLTGANINVVGALINSSGSTGGGAINIGGGPHATVALADARSLFIDAGSTIRADATDSGNGGTIVAWSDGLTTALGTFMARGGPNGGNGGSIETSGHSVDFAGITVDASATRGAAGTWLVDPTDLTVDGNAANSISSTLQGGTSVTLQTNANGTTSGPGNTSGGLGDININSGITWTNAATTLTLSAYHALTFNAVINAGGKMALNTGFDPTYTTLALMNFNPGGTINFTSGLQTGILTINGASYTVDYSGGQLHQIQDNYAGHYAVGGDIDLSSKSFSLGTVTGIVTGLGHQIPQQPLCSI